MRTTEERRRFDNSFVGFVVRRLSGRLVGGWLGLPTIPQKSSLQLLALWWRPNGLGGSTGGDGLVAGYLFDFITRSKVSPLVKFAFFRGINPAPRIEKQTLASIDQTNLSPLPTQTSLTSSPSRQTLPLGGTGLPIYIINFSAANRNEVRV